MFREVYKKANEDIKGDIQILDRAFLKAAQPVKKKSPIMRYSVIGTLAAAVFIIGAVMVNSNLFTQKITKPANEDATAVLSDTEQMTFVGIGVDNNNESLKAVPTPEKSGKMVGEQPDGGSVTTNNETMEIKVNTEDVAAFTFEGDETEEEVVLEVVPEEEIDAKVFSYMYDLSVYEEGEAGVVTEGFVNKTQTPITNSLDAIVRADAECTIEYNRTDVYYDSIENMWKVCFYTEDTLGSCESVYMTGNGVTKLIVYGE